MRPAFSFSSSRLSKSPSLLRSLIEQDLLTRLYIYIYLKTIETNKADSKDATQDKVETFNEDTCNVCAYDF